MSRQWCLKVLSCCHSPAVPVLPLLSLLCSQGSAGMFRPAQAPFGWVIFPFISLILTFLRDHLSATSVAVNSPGSEYHGGFTKRQEKAESLSWDSQITLEIQKFFTWLNPPGGSAVLSRPGCDWAISIPSAENTFFTFLVKWWLCSFCTVSAISTRDLLCPQWPLFKPVLIVCCISHSSMSFCLWHPVPDHTNTIWEHFWSYTGRTVVYNPNYGQWNF